MSRRVRVAAGAVLAVLAVQFAVAAPLGSRSATSGSLVREVVVSVLEPDGAVSSTRVAQLIALDGSSVQIPRDDLDDYRTLSGFSRASSEDTVLRWSDDDASERVALGETSKELPLDLSVTYWLDGRPLSAEEIEGEDGRLRIEIEVRNVSSENRMLVHPAVTTGFDSSSAAVYIPFEYTVRTAFPSEGWTDVEAANAHIQTNGDGDQIVVRPGILSPPLGPAGDTIVIEATGEDIRIPKLQLFALARVTPQARDILDEQIGGLTDLYEGFGALGENLTKIYEGTLEIADGVQELVTGVGRLDERTQRPVIELDPNGDPTTLLGALGVLGNAVGDDVLGGIGERDPVTGEPVVELDATGTPTTLLGAIGFIRQAVRDQILPAIGRIDPATGRAVEAKDDEGKALTLLWGLQSSKDAYDADLIPGMDQLIAGVDQMTAEVAGGAPALIGGLEQIRDGLALLLANLESGDFGDPGFREFLLILQGLLAGPGFAGADPVALATAQAIVAGLIAGLGEAGEVPPDALTVIGGLESMHGPLAALIVPGVQALTDGVLGGLALIRGALVNPEFTKAQAALGGRTPKAYFQECPACFDPDSPAFDPATANPLFQPGFRDAFVLFSEGLRDALAALHTFDAADPGLVDGLEQVAGGLGDVAASLHTFDPDDPGLVDGLQQIEDGITKLAGNLHTFDTDNPGLVDGLGLVRGGIQQVSQGLFALNELGIRTTRGQIGDSADGLALDRAVLRAQGQDLENYTFLAAGADEASVAFVFEIPGQSSTNRDNAVRGALIAVSAIGLAVLGRRQSLVGI